MAIPREAGRITYSTKIRDLKRIPIGEQQKALIVGSLLGDACLHDNWSKTSYRLQIRHSKDQEAYVHWKYEILKDLVLTSPQYYGRTRSVWFRTISHPDLSKLHDLFYQDRKKIIPSDIQMLIADPFIMAIWFMDDGNALKQKGRVRAYHLNTQSFTVAENNVLQQALNKVWGIQARIQKNHGYPRLYIGASDIKKFSTIVGPFVLPSLMYKVFG